MHTPVVSILCIINGYQQRLKRSHCYNMSKLKVTLSIDTCQYVSTNTSNIYMYIKHDETLVQKQHHNTC